MKSRIVYLLMVVVIVLAILSMSYSFLQVRRLETQLGQLEGRLAQAQSLLGAGGGRLDQTEGRLEEVKRIYPVVELLWLGEIIENTLDLEGKTDFEKATAIRSHIYHSVPLERTPDGFDLNEYAQSYLQSSRDAGTGHICGGLAATYVSALESQGIPARYVGFFSRDDEPYDSHATAEFWYQGRWYASDPTFNVMFMHDDDYLSYSELYALINEGKPYEVVSNGYSIDPQRAIEDYYIGLDKLMKYMVVHPSDVWLDGEHYQYDVERLPDGWDGAITLQGERTDVTAYEGFYQLLNQSSLR